MSSFLSRKFLHLKEAKPTAADQNEHRFCVACGYNLRGLKAAARCPECGAASLPGEISNDPLLIGEMDQRRRTRLGLTLVGLCILMVMINDFLYFIMSVFDAWDQRVVAYLSIGSAQAIAWVIGVWLLTTPEHDSRYRRIRWMRLISRWSAFLWLIEHGFLMLAVMAYADTKIGEMMHIISSSLYFFAVMGAFTFLVWLLRLANDAELEEAARKINLAVWMLPLPSLFLALMPADVPWIALAIIGIIWVIWCWFMILLALAIWQMQQHVSWAIHEGVNVAWRDLRQAETRDEIDREVAASIRPTPRTDDSDISLS